MAVLAIVTSSPPDSDGGHLVIARALVQAARDQGHDAHLVTTADYGFGRTYRSYRANWTADVQRVDGRRVDQVISLRYPSFAVRHPRHVCWLNHTMREYYDLWPRLAGSISARARLKERLRRFGIHAVDRWLLTRTVTEVVAQSPTIQRRLVEDFGIHADVLMPPPPPRAYRCEDYGDYIFAVSRLTPLKRIDLLIRALAEPVAYRVRAVVAGEGESRTQLEALAADLGVANRVTFVGRIDDRALVEYYARCRAVCFAPVNEDYGFVTVEAFASCKPVVTCRDSGGPVDLVVDGENGIVCEPTAAALAGALVRLTEDVAFAERLGDAGAARVASLTWPDTINRLVIV